MKPTTVVLFLLFNLFGLAQSNKTTVYFFQGQGSDSRLFDSIQLKEGFEKKCIEYGTPGKGVTMEGFARELSAQIDTTQPYVLVGTSLGGMLCTEMAEFLKPEKVILISSASNRKELPFRYRFQRVVPIYMIVPGFVMVGCARILQPIVEPDRNKNKETFKSMLKEKDRVYMSRTVKMIMRWKRTSNSAQIHKIHGENDHTIPFRNIQNVEFAIENGSHMMTLTRGREISQILNQIL